MLELRLITHTAVTCCWLSSYCLSCVRSLASSLSSSKTVYPHTERVRQPAFWRHPLSFHQTCGVWLPTVYIRTRLTTKFGEKCSSGGVYQTKFVKQCMLSLANGLEQSLMQEISDARNEWRKTSACVYS